MSVMWVRKEVQKAKALSVRVTGAGNCLWRKSRSTEMVAVCAAMPIKKGVLRNMWENLTTFATFSREDDFWKLWYTPPPDVLP